MPTVHHELAALDAFSSAAAHREARHYTPGYRGLIVNDWSSNGVVRAIRNPILWLGLAVLGFGFYLGRRAKRS